MIAGPGEILIESDYKQAELNTLAHLAHDSTMISILADPERDIHSELAIAGFNLKCTPLQVKEQYPLRRDSAKSIVFGKIYGRGLPAITRQVQREGDPDFCLKDAERIEDVLFSMCPRIHEFIEKSHARVITPGFVENPFGRRRYFPTTDDEKLIAEYERQAVNMPVQGTVADLLNLALLNLYYYQKFRQDIKFSVALPFHDALVFRVPLASVDAVLNEAIPWCMTEQAVVPVLGFKLRTDIGYYRRWGESMKLDEAIAAAQAA